MLTYILQVWLTHMYASDSNCLGVGDANTDCWKKDKHRPHPHPTQSFEKLT